MNRLLILLLLFISSHAMAQVRAARILLIPLDDRPPCLQFTVRMGLIGYAEVIAPPQELLGQFTTPGQSEAIAAWVEKQDLRSFDAAIVCLDMLAYGGLVGSRVHQVAAPLALQRLEVLNRIRKKAPKLPVYAQSVVMRLAPSATPQNAAYRQKIARWAEISPYPAHQAEARQLEKEIPAAELQDYKEARTRNLRINQRAIALTKQGIIDYLLLTQDDAKPQGVHRSDHETLLQEIKKEKLTSRVALQAGTDEVSMLLLSRALIRHFGFAPKVRALYSSESTRGTTMPFEDRPLYQTVSEQILAAGAQEVPDNTADVFFYVYASRHEADRAESSVDEIASLLEAGKAVIVADIDPRGDVQGGDSTFTKALEKRQLLGKLSGYASWNTAGNTIGTALPQGTIYTVASQKLLSKPGLASSIYTAQQWFLLHRLLDDYYFHTKVRREANAAFGQAGMSATLLDEKRNQAMETRCQEQLQAFFTQLWPAYQASIPPQYQCLTPSPLQFHLPWNRTFEALIDFDLTCKAVKP
ncbi:hypothetical protein BWI97_21435 [Siphonobacter sp. BAB-5405]|uniref:DUF4127 family protein n=1 Tax=Siphonobacter sp. BAB-5405 TaxID=1864825 RepID=UPI000C80945D|nr:DUF4127 family protein [Siphonobacter sp. BAB-5405]PMD91394.1 hypothetical protein BWI97_21435 [Siphonobacter sp. BAB-5405]